MAEAAPAKGAKGGLELIPEEARDGTRAALLACADTKLLLGYHYGEWTFGAPALEAAIAACSMGQDELGHDEGNTLRHQAGDEGYVAREPIQFRHDDGALRCPCCGECCGQLRPPVESV